VTFLFFKVTCTKQFSKRWYKIWKIGLGKCKLLS